MAFTAWAASTSYSVGDIRRAVALVPTGLVFKCTTAGTSGSSEPDWPTDVNGTTTDGGVTWTAVSAVYADLDSLAPDTIIELFELRPTLELHGTTAITRWHCGVATDGVSNITWNGNSYVRMPVEAEGFDFSTGGALPRPTLKVANSFPLFTASISALLIDVNQVTPGNDLGGAEVRRIRTLKKFLDGQPAADPAATWPEEIWYVDRKASENRNLIVFELASKFDLAGMFVPKRQLLPNICQWEYRSSECTYTGNKYFDVNDNAVGSLAADRCGKRLTSCNKRFANFEANGAISNGSNQLVLTNSATETVAIGDIVEGFGIPDNTTVTNVAGATITLSANATSSSSATVNGTLQSDLIRIIVTDASALDQSMAISGTGLQAGTMIASISGTTVTLNQIADLSVVGTAASSFSAQRLPGNSTNILKAASDVSVSVGQYVTGTGLPTTVLTQVTYVTTIPGGIGSVPYKSITLNQTISSDASATYSFYSIGTQSEIAYSYVGPSLYKIKKTNDGVLPFGSFPGAGRIK